MTYHRNDLDPASKREGAARTVQLPGPRGGYRQTRLLLILATGLWVLTPVLAADPQPSEAPAPVKAQVQARYGTLPLSFEANQGQSLSEVKFLARGAGYALFLTPTEAVLSLKRPQAQSNSRRGNSDKHRDPSGTVLRMQWVGANPTPRVIGEEKLPGKLNYLLGKDPSQWRTGVPTYAKVKYEGVYPGVDLIYYGHQRQLEYDFVLAPGADPHALTLAFEGADRLEVEASGDLVLHTAGGNLRMHKPVIYQEVEGVRRQVDGGYVRKNERQVGFQVTAYDRARPLVIDPVLVYSTYLGGSGGDFGQDIAVDRFGRAYVTGSTGSTDFPTKNPLQPALGGGTDAFVAKLNRAGSALVYSTYLGGSDAAGGGDSGTGIAVDRFGQAYVMGFTASTDFPTKNAVQPALVGSCDIIFDDDGNPVLSCIPDAFVAKLNRAGSELVYSTYLGGSSTESSGIPSDSIAVDRFGRAYVTGFTQSTDFPTKNPMQPALNGAGDAFVAKLNRAGSKLVYSTYLGGSDDASPFLDSGNGIAVDRFGQAYVAGHTSSTDFPTQNPLQPAFGGGEIDAFVAKLNRAGSELLYSTYLGGSGSEIGDDIAVDRFGHAHVTGSGGDDFPIKNPLQPIPGGSGDAFVAKLNRAGSKLVYSTHLGGSDIDNGNSIAVDRFGQAHVTGRTRSTDFPTKDPLQPALRGSDDAFVAKLNRAGSKLVYSTYLGGSESDFGNGIAVDRFGQAYVTGTPSSDFPTKNPLQLSGGAFVTKICDPIERDDGSEEGCDREDDQNDKDKDN